jgi:pSer/pThr/pTyr-binding forkhead associated (FHA) protein
MSEHSEFVFRCRSRDGKYLVEVPDGSTVIVGRHPDVDVVIDNAFLSRQHVLFRNQGGIWTVEYLRSRGPILINGEIMTDKVSRPLNPGDEIRLMSDVVFVIEAAW